MKDVGFVNWGRAGIFAIYYGKSLDISAEKPDICLLRGRRPSEPRLTSRSSQLRSYLRPGAPSVALPVRTAYKPPGAIIVTAQLPSVKRWCHWHTTKASFPTFEFCQGSIKIGGVKVWPRPVGKQKFGIRRLPEQEI